MPPATTPPFTGQPVLTRADAAAAGLTRHHVAALVRRGEWVRLAAGVFCTRATWEGAGTAERIGLRTEAALLRWRGAAASHVSAAALRGWPLPRDAGPPWLTLPPSSGVSARRTGSLVLEVAALPETDLRWVRVGRRRLLLTSPARTVADCLRHLPAPDAVAVADAAGASGVTRAEVEEVLQRQARWPGVGRARSALALVDPRREGWLESTSAVHLIGRGVPRPEPQVEVRTPGGRFLARVDDLWSAYGVVGEADGWGKYRTTPLVSPRDAERALRQEKVREDSVRDTGLEFVRWTSDETLTERGIDRIVERVRRAFARGDPARVRALLVPRPVPPGW